jgi:hypothetical protein
MDRHRGPSSALEEERNRMVNARNVAAKVIVSLVAVGTLGTAGVGLSGGAVAGAASLTAVTTPSATPSAAPSTASVSHVREALRQRACRLHKRNLALYAKAQSRRAARIAELRARGAKEQAAGHTKAAQFRQGAATRGASTLSREQAHLAARAAAVARRNAKLGITC